MPPRRLDSLLILTLGIVTLAMALCTLTIGLVVSLNLDGERAVILPVVSPIATLGTPVPTRPGEVLHETPPPLPVLPTRTPILIATAAVQGMEAPVATQDAFPVLPTVETVPGFPTAPTFDPQPTPTPEPSPFGFELASPTPLPAAPTVLLQPTNTAAAPFPTNPPLVVPTSTPIVVPTIAPQVTEAPLNPPTLTPSPIRPTATETPVGYPFPPATPTPCPSYPCP